MVSIIIPAHNEERSIGRLISALERSDADCPTLEVIVVCNGCTDSTESVVRAISRTASVIVTDVPSKKHALSLGNTRAVSFPRVYVDADVEITAADIKNLLRPLSKGWLASAPRRVVPRDGVNWLVRWYYDVWEALPQVQTGLFGRGVIALSEKGNARVQSLPQVMSDDLVMSEAFTAHERTVVQDSVVIVRPPKTVSDLINRRIRVATGIAEADQAGLRGDASKTSGRTLIAIGFQQPRLLLRLPVFLAITVGTRIKARQAVRRGDFTTWRRDESSRS